MYLVLLFAAAALLGDTCRSANVNKYINSISEMDNNIDANGQLQAADGMSHHFLMMVQHPRRAMPLAAGSAVELTCDALGSPAPSIHWFKNDEPVYEYNRETNELINSNPRSIARISSTLLVTHTASQDIYTCLVTAGSKTLRVTTVVYSTDGSTDLSERSKLYPLAPRIVLSYKVYFDDIGSDIILPCTVKGHPKPHITWLDSQGAVVKRDSRFKVLRSGDLAISSIHWSDMGEYTCRATNVFGTQLAKTFLYPAKAR